MPPRAASRRRIVAARRTANVPAAAAADIAADVDETRAVAIWFQLRHERWGRAAVDRRAAAGSGAQIALGARPSTVSLDTSRRGRRVAEMVAVGGDGRGLGQRKRRGEEGERGERREDAVAGK